MDGPTRRKLAHAVAADSDGVVSRAGLARVGVDHVDVRTEVRAGRWGLHGLQTVAVHNAPLGREARLWQAVWETGAKVAALDGVTALQAAGLRGYEDGSVHVSVVHTAAVKKLDGVRLHKVIRRVPDELVQGGLPRTRPAVAALRGAYWAASDRQAALVLLMTVQQRLASPDQLVAASRTLRGRRRRAFVRQVLADVSDGVQSLGELDFARLCRARGLPEPDRQVVRRGPRGRIYLDVRWERHRLVVEIDGAQHREGLAVSADNLRRNSLTLQHDTVLRIDLIGLRLFEDEFMAQVAYALFR